MENYFVEGLHPYAQQQVRIAMKRIREEDEACGGHQAREVSEKAKLAPFMELSKADLAKMNLEANKRAAEATARAETYEADLSTISLTSMKTVAMAMKRSEELEAQLANLTEQLKKANAENASLEAANVSLAAANSKAELTLKEYALERHADQHLKGLWEVLVSTQIKGTSVAMSIITDSCCGLFNITVWNENDAWMTSRKKGQDLRVASPLRYAVLANRLDVLKEIVAAMQTTGRPVKDTINLSANHRNPTLVFLAAGHGFVDILKYLISLGADVQVTNSGRSTPLHRAAEHGSVECVEVLIAAGCSLFAANVDGDHPIHYAASFGHGSVVRKMLEFRNPLTARNNYRCSPLDKAIQNGDAETIRLLRSAIRSR